MPGMPSKEALDHTSIESTKDLRDHVFTVFNNVYGELKILHNDNERFEEHLKRYDGDWKTLHNDNERFEEHLKKHDEHLKRQDQMFASLAAQTTNPRAVRPMQKIQPVGISTATQGELLFPDATHFPTTVKQFWNLNVEDLTYLCEFYQVTSQELVGGFQSNSQSDTDSESSSSASSATSTSLIARRRLRAIIEQHREKAQLCLADQLQLNFDSIKYHMETLVLVRKQTDEREHRGLKRSVKDEGETTKRRRPSIEERLLDNSSLSDGGPKALSAGRMEKLRRMVSGSEYDGRSHPESIHSLPDIVRWASKSLSDRPRLKDDPDGLPDIAPSKSDTKPSHHTLLKCGDSTKKQRKASPTLQRSQASTQMLTNTPSAY